MIGEGPVDLTVDPSWFMVSRTLKDLVIGPRISFEDRGTHSLEGIEGDWQSYSVSAV